MKTKRFLIILLIILAMTGCNKSIVEPEPEIPENPAIPQEDFPDENFYTFLLENFDANKDGSVSTEEANNVKQIDCSYHYFKSFNGFEHFPNLEKLNMENEYYSNYDIYCDLDLSKNTALTELNATNANIKSLNVSDNPLLKVLRIGRTKIETLDVSKNTQLEILDISNNKTGNIDISKNTALKELYCAGNTLETDRRMTELDVSANVLLEALDCSINNLTKIDITKNPKLKELNISENNIAFLNLTQNNELKKLNISKTQIPSLDIKNTKIDTLYCLSNGGYLKMLDAKGSQTLKMLECNFVEKLDVSASSVETVVFQNVTAHYGEPPIKEMTFLLNNCPNLKEYTYRLVAEYPHYSEEMLNEGYISLNISNCPSLSTFYSNALADIKIDNCPKLKELTCNGVFENLDLSNNINTESVYCYSKTLKTIDLRYCALLTDLYCFGGMKSINLSGNKNLRHLTLVGESLTSFNIDALIHLKYLNIAIAPFNETLNITKNVELEKLIIRDSLSYDTYVDSMKLNVADLPLLKYIQHSSRSLVEVKINNCENLDYVSGSFYRAPYETPGRLKIENCPGLRNVYYPSGNLTDASIRNCGNIDSLTVSGNKLASFQYDGKNLTYLNCSNNQLTSLNINGNVKLKNLDCKDNAINSLTINNCYNIETLDCANNQISILRVDSLSDLRDLYCNGNRLTFLDVSKNPVMDKLDCSENPVMTTLYISRNQNFSVFKKDGQTEVIYND